MAMIYLNNYTDKTTTSTCVILTCARKEIKKNHKVHLDGYWIKLRALKMLLKVSELEFTITFSYKILPTNNYF